MFHVSTFPFRFRIQCTGCMFITTLVLVSCGGRSVLWSNDDSPTSESSSGGGQQTGGEWSTGGASSAGGAAAAGGALLNSGGSGAGGERPGAGGALGSGGAPHMGGASGPDENGEDFCARACEATPLTPGSCALTTACHESSECMSYADGWSTAARDAFVWCLEHDAMCFWSANSCILEQLFPNSTLPYSVWGHHLSVPDGTKVTIAIVDRAMETKVEDGEFSAFFAGPHFGDRGSSVIVWLDSDGDGVCSEEHDLFSWADSSFNNNFDEPSFDASFKPGDFTFGDQHTPPIDCSSWF